jgi:hypothetical protein
MISFLNTDKSTCPRGYIVITCLHKSVGWSVGFGLKIYLVVV